MPPPERISQWPPARPPNSSGIKSTRAACAVRAERRLRLPSLTILTLCLILAACSRGPDRSSDSAQTSHAATAVLLRGIGPDPDSLDQQRARSVEAQNILRDLCEGLTTLGKDAVVAPGLASEWAMSPDGKTYTFKLRPNARWSNGDRVVAADFVAALRRLVDPATASSYAQVIDVIANAGEIG